jgi:glucuronate isomerase
MSHATFLHDDFLLTNEVARELYHGHAAKMPILDFHCHLPPDQIAANHRFETLYDIWLAGDHYKWRAMRSNGIPEKYITGDASPWEKFHAYALTVPYTLRNPLYHWTHLELKRFFGIDTVLNGETARKIWDAANERLATPEFAVQNLLMRHRVAAVCTTDDPVDSLEHHKKIAAAGIPLKVYPTFRPDKALGVQDAVAFKKWTDSLAAATGTDCSNFTRFLTAIRMRHDEFHLAGGRLSDHGLQFLPAEECSEPDAAKIFANAIAGQSVPPPDAARFASFMMVFFGKLDASKNWTKQLHLGAMRNNNSRLHRTLGPDTGFDSIGDFRQAQSLATYLDRLDATGELPKTILYNLNPADNCVFATMLGNFQGSSVAGKIQFGAAWWFLDQKEGIEWQLNALSNLGLLRRFVGMITDSRSFLSYSRHEYFRRILCNLLGTDAVNGELPRDMALLGATVREICFDNARNYLGLALA